ncbi:MAG: DUF882 domain-containing protein [Deltaproteobacteria bacterium]|nr:DUF882 domain-containing protein [Deltaproteobacteria bacterium]
MALASLPLILLVFPYVTRYPDVWQLGHGAVPELPAPPAVPDFPLVTAAGGPEDLGLPEFEPSEDSPRMRNLQHVRDQARERLETWLEEHGEEILERRREPAIQPGELVIGSGRDVPDRFFPLDGTSTPQAPTLAESTAEIVRSVFRYRGSGAERDMDPRLVALLTEAAWFFQSPITLVSGYRPRSVCTRRQSRHIYGAASDIKLEGIPMEILADFFTVLSDGPYGPMGVGRYPRDGFVHVDSRDETYFWTGNQPSRRRHHRN